MVDYGLKTLNIISCPSCSRVENEAFVELAQQVKEMTRFAEDHHITIAVMGCRVNGPGETDDADLGLWCGPNFVNLKRGSEELGRVSLRRHFAQAETRTRHTDFAAIYHSALTLLLQVFFCEFLQKTALFWRGFALCRARLGPLSFCPLYSRLWPASSSGSKFSRSRLNFMNRKDIKDTARRWLRYTRFLGPRTTLQYLAQRGQRNILEFKIPGIATPVYCRSHGPDFFVLYDLLGKKRGGLSFHNASQIDCGRGRARRLCDAVLCQSVAGSTNHRAGAGAE